MKKCNKCGEEKDLSAFSKHKSMPDGLQYYCKPCSNAARQLSRSKKLDEYREKGRKANRLPRNRAAVSAWNKANPEKAHAKWTVQDAIKAGKLAPASACECNDCGKQAEHLHHHSYEREHWLDVVPLCASCHRIRHSYPERFV